MKAFLFLSIFILIGSISHAECLDSNLVERMTSQFNFKRWNGSDFVAVQASSHCDSDDNFYKIVQSLELLEKLESYHKPEASSLFTKEGFFSYFKTRIKNIVIEDMPIDKDCDESQSNIIAYVSPRNYSQTTFICNAFRSFSLHLRSHILFHESRHLDGHSHVKCTHGRNTGVSGCDSSYESQGSYGFGTQFDIFISKNIKDPALKQEARANAVSDLIERFNEYPWEIKKLSAVIEDNGQVSSFDGRVSKNVFKVDPHAVAGTKNGLLTFFNPDGQVKSYAFAPQMIDLDGAFINHFKTKLSPAEQNDLIDIANVKNYGCFLFTKHLVCGAKENFKSLQLGALQPKSLLVTALSLSIVTQSGARIELPDSLEKFDRLNATDLKEEIARNPLSSVVYLSDNTYLGVNHESHLVLQKNEKEGFQEVLEYSGKVIKKVLPFFWSQKLDDL